MGSGTKSSKKIQKAPLKMASHDSKKKSKKALKHARQPRNLIESTPKAFTVGKSILPKRDLTRYVKWPKYIRIQRQEKILLQRLKVPPSINQFSHTLDKQTTLNLFYYLHKYRVETKAEKKSRLIEAAKKYVAGEKPTKVKKAVTIHFGLKDVTKLVEKKKATLVVIAHDVKPIELVVWLPALCRKMGVPYCIVKGKSRLGKVVHKKKAAVVAFTRVKEEDMSSFSNILQTIRVNFNERGDELRRLWGGAILSKKAHDKKVKLEKSKNKEIKVVS